MLCSICEEEEAAFTVIPTGQGDPSIIGPVCFARSGLELAKEILPAEEIAHILGPMFVGPAAAARELDATPKRSKGKARRKADVGAEPNPDGDPAEGAETAAAE